MNYPFDRRANLIFVAVDLYGPKKTHFQANLALDTGATTTLISWDIAKFLGLDPELSTRSTRITTGSGVEWCPVVNLPRMSALGKTIKKLDVLCHDLPPTSLVDGLLGLNFFRGFDLRINFKEGYISLE
jgi:predicted aspartyl protease